LLYNPIDSEVSQRLPRKARSLLNRALLLLREANIEALFLDGC